MIVGRQRELTLAGAFLDAAASRFAVLDVDGEAGIGKTTVWREILERAEAREFRVLACRPVAAEATLSLAAISDLLTFVGPVSLSSASAGSVWIGSSCCSSTEGSLYPRSD